MMHRLRICALTIAFSCAVTAACGGSSDDTVEPPVTVEHSPTDEAPTGSNEIPPCPSDPALQGSEPCVDPFGAVLCRVSAGYPGDELALCAPEPDVGLLLHYGPRNYDDPEEIALFTLGAGGEDETCTFAHTPNEELAYVRNYRGRMRPGSHHLIVTTASSDIPDNDRPGACDVTANVGLRWLVGSQDPRIDVAVGGSGAQGDDVPDPGDPDYGLAQKIDAHTPVRLDLHYTNPTEETLLKEAWVYFDYAKDSEVQTLVDMITFFQGAINVPPYQASETAIARCVAPTDRYVGLLTGHFHQTATRLTVWHERSDLTQELVYETYDWAEPGNLYFRDGLITSPPNAVAGTMGGDHQGYLHLTAGEALLFQCAYSNPTDQTVTLGETAGDEMCNVFGMYYPTDGNVWSCACLGDGCFARQ